MRASTRWSALAVLAILSWETNASAGIVSLLPSVDDCPSAPAFALALRRIVPDIEIVTEVRGLRVGLLDTGPEYEVTAGSLRRTFEDPGRRCEERARKAAVFVALALAPPAIDDPVVAEPKPPAPRPAPRDGLRAQLELGALVDVAPRTGSNTLVSGGAQLRVYLGSAHVGGVVGVAGSSPTNVALVGARAHLVRIPVDLLVRGQLPKRRVVLSADVGVVLTAQLSQGRGLSSSRYEKRLEVGLRVAAMVQYRALPRVAPFVALQLEYVPVPSEFVAAGAGVIGTSPSFWLSGVIGLAFKVR